MKKITWVLLFVIVLTACIAFIIQSNKKVESKSGKPVVKIGVILPLSGDSAHIGQSNRAALEMVLGNLKEKGLKYNYQFVFENNEATARRTATVANKLISIDKVRAVFTIWSPMGGIVASIADKQNVFSFTCAYGTDETVGKYSFNAISSEDDVADLMIKKLREKGVKSVAIFSDYDGVRMMDFLVRKLPKSGIELKGYEKFNIGETNMRVSIIKTNALKPDMYLVNGYPPMPYIFMKQLKENTKTVQNVTSIDGFLDIDKEQRTIAEGLWYIDTNTTGTELFSSALLREKNIESESCAGNMATDLEIFVDAVEHAVLTDGETIPDNNAILAYIQENVKNRPSSSGPVTLVDGNRFDVRPVVKVIKNSLPVLVQ